MWLNLADMGRNKYFQAYPEKHLLPFCRVQSLRFGGLLLHNPVYWDEYSQHYSPSFPLKNQRVGIMYFP